MVKDLVCGATVDENGCDWVSEHNGTKYYFDVSACQVTFDINPGHWIANPHV